MQGDELIAYGFKRILEELVKIEGLLERIEQNTYTTAGETLKAVNLLEKIENASVITQYNSSGIMMNIRKRSADGGLEKE